MFSTSGIISAGRSEQFSDTYETVSCVYGITVKMMKFSINYEKSVFVSSDDIVNGHAYTLLFLIMRILSQLSQNAANNGGMTDYGADNTRF
jgi:hypothetical protein